MFYDFVPCGRCRHYDNDCKWCNLFMTWIVDGCACGEEKEEEKEDDKNNDGKI